MKHNEVISIKHKHVSKTLKLIENLLILASAVLTSVSSSAFTSLIGIPSGIINSVIGLKNYAITVVIKKYKSIINL